MKYLLIMIVSLFTLIEAQAFDYSGFVGVNTGLSQLKGVSNESSKSGYLVGVKGLLTSSFDQFVVDAGLGYYSQEVTSSNFYIKTKTATFDLDARYVLVNDYQLGLGLRSDLGTDNTGTEYIGRSSQSNVLLAKMIVPDKFNDLPMRYEFGLGSTVGQERTLTTAFVGIQIGFPERKVKSAVRPVVKVEEPQPVAPVVEDFKIDLKLAKIYFPTNKHELDPVAKQKLSNLAQYLAKNKNLWNRIKISGHTDIQGNEVDNRRLSQDRADEVLRLLLKNGVDESKLSSYGYGSKVPQVVAQTEDGLKKNRRTEIEFFGVSNRKQVNQDIVRILTTNGQ